MKRRSLLKSTAATAAVLGSAPLSSHAASKQRPNVIVLLTDDQGYGDMSLAANPLLQTPHLDKLSQESIRFTDFHISPASTPTRAELLTGKDCLHNLACADTAGRSIMRRDIPTVAELFRQDGYTTGLFGKWHLGHTYPDRPMDRGFDKALWFKGDSLQSAIEFDNDYVNPRYLDATVEQRATSYCTDLWFDAAMSWMDEQQDKGQAFFTYLATNTPHPPLWPPIGYTDLFKGQLDDSTAALFSMIAKFDENIGRLEEWLQATGAYDNTIVVLLGDTASTYGNSLLSTGSRDQRSSHYESGHRTPCYLRWPEGNFEAGLEVSTPTHAQDILPTLLDLCDVPPGNNSFDGTSLLPLTVRGDITERMFVVQYGLRARPIKYDAAVIWMHWRLQNGVELYDIDADRAQEHDLAQEQPDILRQMREFYNEWWKRLEPRFSKAQAMFIGTGVQNPSQLTSMDWWEVDVADIDAIAKAEGGTRGGAWHIQIMATGEYRVELRRWPFHTSKAIGSDGPRETINGRALHYPVKLISAHQSVLSLDGREQHVDTTPESLGAIFSLRLERGPARLQAWFRDKEANDLCGAFYARITRLT